MAVTDELAYLQQLPEPAACYSRLGLAQLCETLLLIHFGHYVRVLT